MDYTKKRWPSLTKLKTQIEQDGTEKIEEFSGYQLITNKNIYGLSDGEISVYKRNSKKENPKSSRANKVKRKIK